MAHFDFDVSGMAPVVGDGWIQVGGPSGRKVFWDELSPAEQQQVLQYLLSAQSPVLAPPAHQNSPAVSGVGQATSLESLRFSINEAKHAIIISMLDTAIKTHQENAERSRIDDDKRQIQRHDQERVELLYSTYKAASEKVQDPYEPLFAVGMIITALGVVEGILPDPSTAQVGINPVVDMSATVLPASMGDMRAELGLIGAFYAAGMQYFTVAQMARGGPGKPVDPLEFARGFARNAVALLRDEKFTTYLQALLTEKGQAGKPVDPARVAEGVSALKFILAASALALLYKAEEGVLTGQRLADVLTGSALVSEYDPKFALSFLLKEHLSSLSPHMRATILNALMDYFDKNPSFEALANPARVLSGIYNTLPGRQLASPA